MCLCHPPRENFKLMKTDLEMCQTPLPMSRREHRAFHTALVSGHRKLTQPRPCVNSAPAPFQLFSVSLHPRCSQPAATTYGINAQLSMSMVAINGFQLLTLTRKAKIFQRGFVFKLNQNAAQARESRESPLTSPWASETWFKRSFSTQLSLVFAFMQCVQLSRHQYADSDF